MPPILSASPCPPRPRRPRRPLRRLTLSAAGSALAGLTAPVAHADILDWLALTLDAPWSATTQWEDATLPGPGDIARFPGHGSGWLCRVDLDPAVLGVQMLDPSGTVLIQSGRTLTIVDDPTDLDGDLAIVAGTLELASGSSVLLDASVNGGGQLDNDGLVLGWGTTSITAPLLRNDGVLRIEGRPGISSTMSIDADVMNHGLIDLDSTGNGWSMMTQAAGLVTNAPGGTVRFGNGGSFLTRYWRGGLDSFGAIHVTAGADARFDIAGTTLRLGGGDLTVDPGGSLVNGGAPVTFEFENVSVVNDGIVHLTGNATTRFTDATLSGIPVRISGGTLEFTPGATVDGVLHVDGSVQHVGDVPAGATLEVRGVPGVSSTLTTSDPMIHGILDLVSTGNGWAMLQNVGLFTVAGNGEIRMLAGGSQPLRYLRSDIDSTGLLLVGSGADARFDQTGSTLWTSGELVVEAGGQLLAPSTQHLVIDGGSVTVDGALDWNNGSVTWNAGSIAGEPWELASSHLILADGVSGPAEFRTFGSSLFTGDIPADVRLRIEGRPGISSTTSLTADTTVDGSLDLDSTGNGWAMLGESGPEARTLTIGSGGMVTLLAGGSQPARYLRTNIVNDGALTLEAAIDGRFDASSRTLRNRGTLTIPADSELLGTGANTLRLESGTIFNQGLLRWQGGGTSRVELAGGVISGEPIQLQGATLAFDAGSTATAAIVASASGSVEGDIPASVDLTILGVPGVSSTYGVAPGAILSGDITLASTGNGWAQLAGPSAVEDPAVNLGTITALPGGTQPARYLSLHLRNEGEIRTLAGTETLLQGDLVNAGLLVAEGPLRRVAGGLVDFVNESGGTLAGVGPVGSAPSIVLSAGTTSPGENGPARMDILGDWEQIDEGRLRIEIGGLTPGTEHDILVLGDDAILGGRLDLVLVDGFAPAPGTSFVVLEAAGDIVGTFDLLSCPRSWSIAYTDTQVIVTVVAAPTLGDVNCDGLVDFSDLLQVLTAYGPCAGCIEDIDGDGAVAFSDLLVVLSNWS